jgi:hypothetical protein
MDEGLVDKAAERLRRGEFWDTVSRELSPYPEELREVRELAETNWQEYPFKWKLKVPGYKAVFWNPETEGIIRLNALMVQNWSGDFDFVYFNIEKNAHETCTEYYKADEIFLSLGIEPPGYIHDWTKDVKRMRERERRR